MSYVWNKKYINPVTACPASLLQLVVLCGFLGLHSHFDLAEFTFGDNRRKIT